MTRLYATDAELYDIAFDWDVGEEVDWLLERLGSPASVLEPGCGSARMLAALTKRGVDAVGIDLSPEMLALAERRAPGRAVLADMADFDLGRRFEGAICPIGTLGHLRPAELVLHLDRMAAHLEPGARYLAQFGLVDTESGHPPNTWEAERGDVRLLITWELERLDHERGIANERSRIEVLAGPDAGRVVEETHAMTVWTPERWLRFLAESPFEQVAQYDASRRGERPAVEIGATGGLMWHELTARS